MATVPMASPNAPVVDVSVAKKICCLRKKKTLNCALGQSETRRKMEVSLKNKVLSGTVL